MGKKEKEKDSPKKDKAKDKAKDKVKEEKIEEVDPEAMDEEMEKAAEWVDEALTKALDPLWDELEKKDDPALYAMMGPAMIQTGIGLILPAVGEKETIDLLKAMIKDIKDGVFESPIEWEEGEAPAE